MAFHQPTRQLPQQLARPASQEPEASQALAPQIRSGPDEEQTWVLFSPATDVGTATSYISSLRESRPTPGRSRLSDDGSVNTYARSDRNSRPRNSVVPSEGSLADGDLLEDDAELDSLDSHLPEFREFLDPYNRESQEAGVQSLPVLPAHDGLGSFQLRTPGASGVEVQNQLYAFERYNPRRLKRRRESLELAHIHIEGGNIEEVERMRRIESWRMEHSQFLLAEIQRETRRRRLSQASFQKLRAKVSDAEDIATLRAVGEDDADTPMASSEWHDQDESEGFWSRITRRVIEDMLGIDYNLLPIIFGEALPELDDAGPLPQAKTPKAMMHIPARQNALESQDDSTWQLRALDRISRELGMLMRQLSTHHPGAFATYSRMQQATLPYGGLPVIPEAATPETLQAEMAQGKPQGEARTSETQFQPTIPSAPRPEISEQPDKAIPSSTTSQPIASAHENGLATFTQQEWEQDLDIKLVYRYLRSRFLSSRSTPASSSFSAGTAHLATCSTQDAAAKAERVRQYHPLVSRAPQAAERRPLGKPGSVAAVGLSGMPPLMRHASGSCASQSTRRSARRSSVSSRHSSRHYWDIGANAPPGSIGTGSIITSVGPMGSWGEV
jgi:hypothetical protein